MSNKSKKYAIGKDVVLFTGQSGIEVEKCLQKLRVNESAPATEIVKVEKVMIQTYKKMDPDKETYDDRKIIIEILSLPPSTQRELWKRSFKLVKKNLKRQSSKKLYLLSFHACFYHQKNREFLSPINVLQVKDLARSTRIKMVIVLVDDCYDIYTRLLAEDKMFFEDIRPGKVAAEKAMITSIWNLLTILSWREVEIAFSRKIAEVLAVPFFVVAVKHPTCVIQRLIRAPLDKLKIFYLAHPITSVRKRTYARRAKFPEELNAFAEKCLEKQKDTILFIPDTIDELRIKKENNIYLPELNEGWPLPFEEDSWLFHPLPREVSAYKPLNPRDVNLTGKKMKQAVSHVIEILAKKIDEQITSRDYALVEQSKDGVIIYKPYWQGDISGGALKEAQYNSDLRQTRDKERKTFVLEEQENLGKYRIAVLFKELVSFALRNVDNAVKEKMTQLNENWKGNASIVAGFYEGNYPLERMRSRIDKELPDNYDFSEDFLRAQEVSLHGASMHEKEQRLDAGWAALYNKVMNLDPFRDQCVHPSDGYFISSSAKFQSTLHRFLKVLPSEIRKKPKRRKK